MAKVICICGRICSGKSTYAEKLRIEQKAVVLSIDEITLALFAQQIGEKHDEYVEKTEQYLLRKSLEIVEVGVNVILDWGFWTKEERTAVKEYYGGRGIACEFHGIDIDDETWKARLQKRNNAVLAGETSAYYVDENIAEKFRRMYSKPKEDEIDVWIRS